MDKQIEKYELSEKEEEYIRMYHEYFVLNWKWNEICKYHNCSKTKVSAAIRWVIDNKLKMPSKFLLKGAIDSISQRIQTNRKLYDDEIAVKRNARDNEFIIALSKEIREDEKILLKLQEICTDEVKNESNISSAQVLGLIKAAISTPNEEQASST